MNDITVIVCATLILLLPSSGIRVSAAPVESHEEAVITSYSSGDHKALADSLESMIIEHPLDPVSVLHYGMLFRMAEIFGPEQIEKTAAAVKEKLRRGSGADSGSSLLKLNCELERMLYRTKGIRGAQITNELKPVRKWTLYGPYQRYGAADIDYQFQPELISSGRDIFPQKRITITESDGWLNPGNYLFPGQGVVYASVSFRTQRPVKIRLYSDSSYRVYINGREAARNTQHEKRNMRVIRVLNSRDVTITVKMIGSPFEKLRMLVTDEHNAVIEPDIVPGTNFMNECEAVVELDYPYEPFVKESTNNPALGNRHLGLFFDDLESMEAVDYYKRSVSSHGNALTSFLLANTLMDRHSGDRASAGYNEGLAIINDLREQHRDFLPAWQKKMEHCVRSGDFLQAYGEGKRLAPTMPGNPYFLAAYLICLDALDYEKEFEESVALVKRQFPGFIDALKAEAHYFKKRDRGKFLAASQILLQRNFSVPGARSLLREYISRGDYHSAQTLIQTYNFNNNFNRELLETLIKKRDFKAARSLVFKLLMIQESPYLYDALGTIDMLQAEDPSMYIQKLLQVQPSLFSIADYARYLELNTLDNPFRQFLDSTEPIGTSLFRKDFGQAPSTILYRGRVFLICKDGSSRVYCEEIVHVGTDEGVKRWGDIRLPYRGRVRPVHLRVYDAAGNRSDSFTMQSIDNDRYVNISSLTRNSIIHLSYIVDNPAVNPAGSRFFWVPLEYLQQYDEPVARVSIKVIAPEEMNVVFQFKNRVAVQKTSIEGLRLHEAVIENISAIKKEPYSGGRQNCLDYYSFSTMDGFNDFSIWYQGLKMKKSACRNAPVTQFKKDTIEKTITAVYDFVAREIELQRNVLYLPDYAENTLYRKSGTAEDKVIVAQTLLDRLGIRSYVAFARNKILPAFETCLYPEYFTHALLCVPLDVNNALWLDFSSRYLRCGVTSCAVAGTDAVVLLRDSFRLRRVQSLDKRSTVGRYDIVIKENGSALCDVEAAFIDSKGAMRAYFGNPLYREESVHRFFSVIIPGFSIDSFRVDNYNECSMPFIIAAKGTGSGIAITDSKRLILQPVLNKCEVYDYVALPVRVHPLAIGKPIDEKETYRYTLPDQYEKQEIERTQTLNNRFGSCRVVISKKSGSPVLEVKKEIHIKAMVIKPIDYDEFVSFCLELKRIENDTVILKK